jgi:soluble lytic murein transglycosylase
MCGGAAAKPATPAKPADLAARVRAYRASPTLAHRAAVESWAIAHPKDAAATRLALGVVAYEQKDYDSAIASLRKAAPQLPKIADYTAYYLAAASVESNQMAAVVKELAPLHNGAPVSPFATRAWLLEAQARKAADPAAAVKLLRDRYAELPQPDGDAILADCYQAANDLVRAADFYQRVYYRYVSGDAAARSTAALLALRDSMGPAYPQPLPQQRLERADRLLAARLYGLARSEYQSLLDQVPALERDQAMVRIGVADYRADRIAQAYAYLSGLAVGESEADAERLYYVEECARHMDDDNGVMGAVKQLAEKYPKSLWRMKALVAAAGRYLVSNRPDDFLPLYEAAYRDFPNDPAAGLCHWKVTFQAYLHGKPEAAELLREHLRNYPLHPTTGAALYFLGRQAEGGKDYAGARAIYQQLAKAFENYYYGSLARRRLGDPQIQSAGTSEKMAEFLAAVPMPQARPVPAASTPATALRIERSRILRNAGLGDLADGELRFGSRTDGQPALLAMELAASAEAPHLGLHVMKAMTPDNLALKMEQAPRRFWELLYPLPYRAELTAAAQRNALDPFLVAGLIRQESEFDPQAQSLANAFGLTQVRPGTGRMFARRVGIGRFNARLLFQPAANLKIGTAILRSMLDQNGGSLEQTLAAYNAGPNRVAEWLSWNNYREPAEFVESIPFTETRDYVQAVERNADMYRRIYR